MYQVLNLCARRAFYALLGTSLLCPTLSLAETPEARGLAIAQEGDRRNSGWVDSRADMKMVLRNKRGEESARTLRVKSLEVDNDGDKSLTIFDEPKDVRGTALLTHSHKVGADDQWLYLPAIKRVKRIASKNKSGPFMGSEFAFEDLSSQEVEKFSYRYLQDEPCPAAPELTCFVLERTPADEDSGYTRQVAWIDQGEYRIHKIDYYDRKKSLLKTLTNSEFKQYLGQYWRPAQSLMINHQTGKSTLLTWDNMEFKTGVSASEFNEASLDRVR